MRAYIKRSLVVLALLVVVIQPLAARGASETRDADGRLLMTGLTNYDPQVDTDAETQAFVLQKEQFPPLSG